MLTIISIGFAPDATAASKTPLLTSAKATSASLAKKAIDDIASGTITANIYI